MEFPADEAVPQRCLQSGRMPPVDLRQHRRFTGRLHRLVESCVHSFSHAEPRHSHLMYKSHPEDSADVIRLRLVSLHGLAMLYKFAPRRPVKFRRVWLAALLGTVFLQFGTHLFTQYLASFTNFNALYGAFATIMGLLLWIYYTGVVLLLESLKGKRCCRQVKFYSGFCALAAWRFCLSRILKAGPGPWIYEI